MERYAQALQDLIAELRKLPGIGAKTAERLAYHILRSSAEEALQLAGAIERVKKSLRNCKVCFNVAEGEFCAICSDPERHGDTICVVEQPRDLFAIEAAGSYRGHYHVLLGVFSPLDGVAPEDLTVEALVERVRGRSDGPRPVREVILATNPNFEGDGTALFIAERLRGIPGLTVSRLARGMPSGSHLEHVSRTIVADAIEGRRSMGGS
jgi:recombination protein RecR